MILPDISCCDKLIYGAINKRMKKVKPKRCIVIIDVNLIYNCNDE